MKTINNKNQAGKKEEKKTKNNCNVLHIVDESYRMDDNTNYSSTAIEENACLNEPLVPGVGIVEADLKADMKQKIHKEK